MRDHSFGHVTAEFPDGDIEVDGPGFQDRLGREGAVAVPAGVAEAGPQLDGDVMVQDILQLAVQLPAHTHHRSDGVDGSIRGTTGTGNIDR